LCGYWTPATFDHYSNQGWYGLLKPQAVFGDVDRLRPRLLYGKLQEHWGSSRASGRVRGNIAWMLLLCVSLGVAGLLTLHYQRQFLRRSAQVADLEGLGGGSKSGGGLGGGSSSSNAATGRSPLLGGRGSPKSSPKGASAADRRAGRNIPAGRSSRATPSSSAAAQAGTGSTAASPLLQQQQHQSSPLPSSGGPSPIA